MNRQLLAIIALLIAVALFAAPLVSPIPDQKPHLRVSVGPSEPDPLSEEYVSETTYRYHNLSDSAQHFFDTQAAQDSDDRELILPEEVPAPWAPPGNVTAAAIANNSGQIVKNGRYYPMYIGRYTPQPPLLAVILRFGALGASIGLGTVAGYFVLTAET